MSGNRNNHNNGGTDDDFYDNVKFDNFDGRTMVLHVVQRADMLGRFRSAMLAVDGWHVDYRKHIRIL